MDIQNPDRVSVLNLRGFRLPITAPSVEDWIVRWLEEREVTAWVVDPFARAAVGTDENSNTEVGVWLDTLDVIKERAGVRDLILPTHTGRAEQEAGQERARGATRLDDWADVRWLLTKDEQGDRFFRATGRDVEVARGEADIRRADRALTIGGGDRRWVKSRRWRSRSRLRQCLSGLRRQGIQHAVSGNKEQTHAARDLITATRSAPRTAREGPSTTSGTRQKHDRPQPSPTVPQDPQGTVPRPPIGGTVLSGR